MYNISVWGYGQPLLDTLRCFIESGSFSVSSVKYDRHRENDTIVTAEVKALGIDRVYVDDYPNASLDAVFVVNYNRIIPEDLVKKYLIVNYHVGVLPKWRGNSANGWAILNGENYSGYTIHRVSEILDGGGIYYQFSYPYVLGETYASAKTAMRKDYLNNISSILEGIISGRIVAKTVDVVPYVYCIRFRPSDGIINWTEKSDVLMRRFYVFAPPLGSGLKFFFNGKIFSITNMKIADSFAVSYGVPGGVVYIDDLGIWVKTGDTAVILQELQVDGNPVDMYSIFKIGQRL